MSFPGGTVTFLFTDIEGSTSLLQQLGDDYGQFVADHRRLLREVFQQADGREVDTQGARSSGTTCRTGSTSATSGSSI